MFVNQLVLEPSTVLRPATQAQHTIHFNVLQRATESVIVIAYGPPPPAMFTMSRVSDGMAQNAALALTAAMRLGVSATVLQQRLREWQPAPMRGEVRRRDGQLLYLDCYNANPASMADALAIFQAIAPSSEPRLYVLGGMEELGEASAALHRALGRSLNLREGDRLLAIGSHASEVCAGVLEQGDFSRQIQTVSAVETIAPIVAEWRGAIFVKGSRRYQLERVLAGGVLQEAGHA
jgi:UDP-N-acetylmuramyl pentapeptide synthase